MGTICTKIQRKGTRQPSQQGEKRKASEKLSTAQLPEGMTMQHNNLEDENIIPDTIEEFKLCLSEELQENEMKVFEAGEKQVLVVKENGKVYAMGTKCTHFGAPLNTGIFCQGKVYCPWHGACFDGKTGDIEEYPALDPVPVYPINIDPVTDEVKITISARVFATMNHHSNQKPLCKASESSNEVVLIIGSGAAGHSCAETLRQEGYTGRVVIVTKDMFLPYDRTKLSKAMNLDGTMLSLRSEEYYSKADIEFIYQVSAKAVDVEAKSVLLSNGVTLLYSHLVIATGGRPRPIPCPGTHLSNVYLLRTPNDANLINEITNRQRHVVIVGTSFIGMEVAAYLVDKAASVTVVGRSSTPFANVFGTIIGRRLQELHEEKGVEFIMDAEVAELGGDEEGNLTEVTLTSGRILRADLLIVGLGVLPSTDFLRASDVILDSRGYVPVDEYMRTSCQGVYAVGDIASFPLHNNKDSETPKLVNVGHWQMALHHGRTAALTILGRSKPIYETAVPFFWSSMFGKSVRYCGYAPTFDDVVIHGDVENLKFAAFLCEDDIVQAVITINFDPIAVQFGALLKQGKKLSKLDVSSDPKSWATKLHCN